MAALKSVEFFEGGFLLGKTADCGLRGVFGSCNGKSENFARLSDFASQIAENVYTLSENLDEKFFMVTCELNWIKQAQDEDTNPRYKSKLGGNSRALRSFQTKYSHSSRL